MTDRFTRRADELASGDVLDIKGALWTVLKAKSKGKLVKLAIESRRGSFTESVAPDSTYTVLVRPKTGAIVKPVLEKRTPSRSRQARWADPKEITPPPESTPADPSWKHVGKEDRPLVEELGAKLVGVEVEGGKLVVPPANDTTLFGHLATMHGVRFDGATVAEAKAWARSNDPGGDVTADQALDVLSFQRAYELHERLHADFASLPVPHWHRSRAPK